jgi:hypothetical protein
MNQAILPGLEAKPVHLKEDPDEFDWLSDKAVILEQQRSIAVYATLATMSSFAARAPGSTMRDKRLSFPRRMR